MDADTNAAIYGQLAGACYGEEGIPRRWRTCLTDLLLIVALADQLLRDSSVPVPLATFLERLEAVQGFLA